MIQAPKRHRPFFVDQPTPHGEKQEVHDELLLLDERG